MKIPDRLYSILKRDPKLLAQVIESTESFGELLSENKLFFFEEYTDHGKSHIEGLLSSCDKLIHEETIRNILTPLDISVLILSSLVHDIGMHLTFEKFQILLDGGMDQIRIKSLDEKKWVELWKDYCADIKKFDLQTLINIFGKDFTILRIPDLKNKESLDGQDKKFIGEFIRRNHPRIAHEIAMGGFAGPKGALSLPESIPLSIRNIIGLVARSHGLEIRSLFNHLREISENNWMIPHNIHVVYLMVLLRLGDILQIDSNRIPSYSLILKSFTSPISYTEFLKHHSIQTSQLGFTDKETIHVVCNPNNSRICKALKDLFANIQSELDKCWAILGEIYGNKNILERPELTRRRITSNLDDLLRFSKGTLFVPEFITLNIEPGIVKLLVAPLYGSDPSYGVRELLQNSVDACLERKYLETTSGNHHFDDQIKINIYSEENRHFFEIGDNGKGMNVSEIKDFFFRIGASFRNSADWKKVYISGDNETLIPRIGRFGIGILAGFLIGQKMEVYTRRFTEDVGYNFIFSLNTNNVEVYKKNNIDPGTIIRIEITEAIKNELIENSQLKTEYYGEDFTIKVSEGSTYKKFRVKYNWDMWYTLEFPKLIIKIPGQEPYSPYKNPDPAFSSQTPEDWCSFKTNAFEKVNWTFSKKYSRRKLTVNGIVIPGGFSFTSNYITKDPLISVFDFNANLNLSLNRDSLQNNLLPFERLLKEEIYKHLIAKILIHNLVIPSESALFEKAKSDLPHFLSRTVVRTFDDLNNGIFNHAAFSGIKILFSKNGFIINHPAFLKKFEDYKIINAQTKYPWINYSEIKNDKVLFYNGSGQGSFAENGLSLKQRLNDDKVTIINTKDYISKIENAKKIGLINYAFFQIDKILLGNESLQITECFNRILGNDWLIPYDSKERKKKFENAFSELEPFFIKNFYP